IEASRHDAVHLQTTIDTGGHRVPELIQSSVQFVARYLALLIRAFHLRDGQARTSRHVEHFAGTCEGIWYARSIAFFRRCAHCLKFCVSDNKPATDRVVDRLEKQPAITIIA